LEEALRLESPIQWLLRVATQETVLAGVTIPAGSTVIIVFASANRDEARFPDPDRFRPDRPNLLKDQLAFGRGVHLCIGAPLARLEGQLAFAILLSRLTNFRLAPGRNDLTHAFAYGQQRGLNSLQIEFDRV